MTNTTPPPSGSEDPLSYAAAADEYVSAPPVEEEEEDDNDDDSSSGEGGGKGLKSKKDYEVILDPILDFSDDEDLSEEDKAASKLRKLGLSPMSLLASGASAFASENDLSRKVFMAHIGLVNLEIKPRDIASPELIALLDKKQAERRAIFGIKTLDEIVSGAIGSAAAVVGLVSASVTDYVKDKKEERKIARQIRDFESGKEEYSLDSDDYSEAKSSLTAVEFPVQDDQGDDLAARERILDLIEERQSRPILSLAADGSGLLEIFNILAAEVPEKPVPTVKLSDDVSIGVDLRDIPQDFNPAG